MATKKKFPMLKKTKKKKAKKAMKKSKGTIKN